MKNDKQQNKTQQKKIGQATYIIQRKFKGNKTLKQILERLILSDK